MAGRLETMPLALTETGVGARARERAAHALGGVIFWALLALVPLAAAPYGTVDEWWESSFQCVVLSAAALWAVEGMLSGKWFVREHALLVPLVPLLGFVFLQAVPLGVVEVAGVGAWRTLSASPFETRLAAFRFLALLLLAAALLRYTSSQRRLRALTGAVICAGVLSALFGIARQAMHHEGDGFILPRLQPQLGYGQFANNNHFALLMEMSLGPLLGLMAGARRWGRRTFLCLTGATVVWSALVLSNSRGGILAMLGQVMLFALFYRAGRPARGTQGGETSPARRRGLLSIAARCCLFACLLLVVCGGAFWMGGEQLLKRAEDLRGEVGEEVASERAYPRRAHMWQATWQMIKERPVVGSGFGGYWLAISRHYDASGVSSPQQAHNDYLELLASGGIVCVAPVAWFVVLFVRRVRKCMRTRADYRRTTCLGALLGLHAVALHSFVDFGLHVTANAVVFTALVVIATAHVETGRKVAGGDGKRGRTLFASREALDGLRPRPRMGAARAAAVVLCLLACVVAMRETARAGMSRWYSLHLAQEEYSLALAARAVRLSPSDPIAHLYRSNMLSAEGRDDAGLEELERAAALAPEDYSLWMQIGFAREAAGRADALSAFDRAVYLAPFYAQPRWQLGTALFRAGQRERAFLELARADESDAGFLPQTLDLLWVAFDGDADAMERALPPQSAATRLAFVRSFIEHDRTDEALKLLRQAGSEADAERQTLTASLIAAKKFTAAYDAWSSGGRGGRVPAVISDGSFEESIGANDVGFGWQVIRGVGSVSVALDTKEPRDGARSLLIDFRGASAAGTSLVRQLILVEPNTRYGLSFAARTQGLMTTGPPTVELNDADGGRTLVPPIPLTRGDVGWHDYAAEFITDRATSAVLLTVRRQECPLQPCLILGRVWLDGFSLRKL
ncbi:MAG: O-antigen ligase family protein [Pyrinomonadaceae bacterium]